MPPATIRIRKRAVGSAMGSNMLKQGEIWKRTAAVRIHGGRDDMLASLYPMAPTPWIDLSTGINPICWPVSPLPPALYQRLPLAADMTRLIDAAGGAYGCPHNVAIVRVPGSEIAIRLLPRINGAKHVGILAPTYGSHAAAWRAAGAEVHELDALPEQRRHDLEALVVVNPNNPDGRVIAQADLVAFAQAWTMTGRRLIVDEAFADVRPEASLVSLRGLAGVGSGLRDRDRGVARHRVDRGGANPAGGGSTTARPDSRRRGAETDR